MINGRAGDKPRVLLPEDQKHDLGEVLQGRLESGLGGFADTPSNDDTEKRMVWVKIQPFDPQETIVSLRKLGVKDRLADGVFLFHWLLNMNGGNPLVPGGTISCVEMPEDGCGCGLMCQSI